MLDRLHSEDLEDITRKQRKDIEGELRTVLKHLKNCIEALDAIQPDSKEQEPIN
jgi:hypothetical protein